MAIQRPTSTFSNIHPIVYFDITIDNEPAGRITISLFSTTAPRTSENFRALCTGEKGKGRHCEPLHYKGSAFHRVIPGLSCNGGNIVDWNKCGESIYGFEFMPEDDIFVKNHSSPGVLSMANINPLSNDSNFFICTSAGSPCENGKCCLGFGRVIGGFEVLKDIENAVGKAVVISDCGEISNNVLFESSPSSSSSSDSRYVSDDDNFGQWVQVKRGHSSSDLVNGDSDSPTLSSSPGNWSDDDFGVWVPAKRERSPKVDTRSRLFIQKRSREEFEKEFVPIFDEHLKNVDNIKAAITKLLEKETDLKGLLPTVQKENCPLAEDFTELLSAIQTKITYLKKKVFILNAVSSLSDEHVKKVECVIKQHETDASRGLDSDWLQL